MRKVVLGALLLAFLAAPALAYTVEWKTKSLPIAGDVYFTSSFHASEGDTITIEIQPADESVNITRVELVKATPKPKMPGGSIGILSYGVDGKSATLDVHFDSKKTLHLWVYLSTGEHIGVNVHS